MSVALYPGSFDPMTLGHIDIIRRASMIFDKVIVAVMDNYAKKYCFSPDERIRLAEKSLAPLDLGNVEIVRFGGLLADFVNQCHANVIVKGIRNASDFDYELAMAEANRQLNRSAETVFFTPSVNCLHISSSIVRSVAAFGGNISKFVSPEIEKDVLNHMTVQKL